MTKAQRIVNAILNDLRGRSGIGNEFDIIDEEVEQEIHTTLEEIVERELAKP